jgi:predicted nucleic acid-binding Zn finger protein
VDLEEGTCTCPDYMNRDRGGRGCKHLRLARILESKTSS